MNRGQRWIVTVLAAVASLVLPLTGVAAAQQANPSTPSAAASSGASTGTVQPSADPVPGQYIVTLKTKDKGRVLPDAAGVVNRHGGKVTAVWGDALQGYAAEMTPDQAAQVAADPSVERVEQDGYVHTQETQAPTPSWGLDRIDQTNLPLDNSYTSNADGTSVHAYVIDTGILISHTDFGGRASVGADFAGDVQSTSNPGIDCAGHGTHVAGTIGGTTYGIAKNVQLVSVRVLDCGGNGTYAGVISGINWVTAHAVKPAVANMSLGGPKDSSLNAAVANSVASGVTYAIAAGNNSSSTSVKDACNYSPSSEPSAITVGATTNADQRASYSNGGTCVDILAPGSSITSDWDTSTTATNTISGTSMATPHVVGVTALYLQHNPSATPNDVVTALTTNADSGVLQASPILGTGTPNLLLNEAGPPAPALSAQPGPSIHLSWTLPTTAGNGITKFEVFRGPSAGNEGGTAIATLDPAKTSYDDNTVTNGTTYYYTVRATNWMGTATSNEMFATSANVPGAPTLNVPATASNTVNLTWSAPGADGGAPITGYKVYRGTTPNGESVTPLVTLGSGATSYGDATAANGTTWYYKVAAINAVGETASNERSASPTGPPTAPTGLVAAGTSGQVKLTWGAPANDGGLPPITYKVFRSTTSGFAPALGNQIATPSSTTYTDTDVTNGTTYFYVVEAHTSAGDSPPTPQVSATVAQPIDVLVRGLGDGIWSNREADGSNFTGFSPIAGSSSTANPALAFDGSAYRGFVRGADGSVFMTSSTDGASWSNFQKLGGSIIVDPVAATDGNGVVKIFVVGIDYALWVGTVDHGSFQGFARLGGILSSVPGVAYDGSGYQVVVRGNDFGMYSGRLTVAGPAAFGYAARGGILTAAPAVAMDGTTVKFFVRGNDLGLYTASVNVDGSGFSGYSARGGTLWSTPEVANDGSGVRLVLRGSDNQLWTAKWNSNGSFTGYTPLGGILVNDPSIVSDGVGTRVFVVGLGNGLWTGTMKANGSGWTGFAPLGGTITAIPAAAAGR